jgi:hypothetical protein
MSLLLIVLSMSITEIVWCTQLSIASVWGLLTWLAYAWSHTYHIGFWINVSTHFHYHRQCIDCVGICNTRSLTNGPTGADVFIKVGMSILFICTGALAPLCVHMNISQALLRYQEFNNFSPTSFWVDNCNTYIINLCSVLAIEGAWYELELTLNQRVDFEP